MGTSRVNLVYRMQDYGPELKVKFHCGLSCPKLEDDVIVSCWVAWIVCTTLTYLNRCCCQATAANSQATLINTYFSSDFHKVVLMSQRTWVPYPGQQVLFRAAYPWLYLSCFHIVVSAFLEFLVALLWCTLYMYCLFCRLFFCWPYLFFSDLLSKSSIIFTFGESCFFENILYILGCCLST